jgi:hypothetical protein
MSAPQKRPLRVFLAAGETFTATEPVEICDYGEAQEEIARLQSEDAAKLKALAELLVEIDAEYCGHHRQLMGKRSLEVYERAKALVTAAPSVKGEEENG